MTKTDCTYIHCAERIKMLTWKDTSKPKYWEMGKDNLEGIIKCNNPNCPMTFNYIDWKDSIEYLEGK